jgi:uncharacterized membrane protein YbaN (DUF454 family)
MRKLHHCLGYGSITLAVLGLVLPLLPTTPFLLLAVWCFARSDPKRAERLYRHPRFGSLHLNWRDEGAIPLPAKAAAVGALGLSYATILWSTDSRPLHLILALVMGGVALYLITRPRPSRA